MNGTWPAIAPDLQEWTVKNNYVHAVWLPEPHLGKLAFVVQTVTGAQIGIGDLDGVAERYSYSSLIEAAFAYSEWQDEQFAGEPTRWARHVPSNRRRTYDRSGSRQYTEEVRP